MASLLGEGLLTGQRRKPMNLPLIFPWASAGVFITA